MTSLACQPSQWRGDASSRLLLNDYQATPSAGYIRRQEARRYAATPPIRCYRRVQYNAIYACREMIDISFVDSILQARAVTEIYAENSEASSSAVSRPITLGSSV